MFYLAAQIWLHLGLAFVLGGGVAWWHLRRSGERQGTDVLQGVESQDVSLVERLTVQKNELELAVGRLTAELETGRNAAAEVGRRLAATESELMDSASAHEQLASATETGDRELAAARSDLQHAREELLLKTDELAHRRAEWLEESAVQREDIETLRSQLGRRRPKGPRTPRLEPRLPEQLILNEGDPENRVTDDADVDRVGPAPRDDLTQIKGVGRVLAGLLDEMGIHTFREIAEWSASDVERIQANLPQFPGRIRRDEWVSQAAELEQTSRV